MKINIFFIDEDSSSRNNGIGTFRRMFLSAFSKLPLFKLSLISFNAPVSELTRKKQKFGTHYSIPAVTNGVFRESGPLIWPLLSLYIKDSTHNIFIFNHSPASDFINCFKDNFPKSRTIFIIHDQGWNASLKGSSSLLEEIVINNNLPECVSQQTAEFVRNYCEEERKIYGLVDKVISLCNSTCDVLEKIYDITPDKYELVANGYEHEQLTDIKVKEAIRKELGVDLYEKILIFSARSVTHKGILALLKALDYLQKKDQKVRCVIATGLASVSKYEEFISPVARSIIFTGHLQPDALRKWYLASDIGVLCSYTEQCSYSAMEMRSLGKTIKY